MNENRILSESDNKIFCWSLDEKKMLIKSQKFIVRVISKDETICITSTEYDKSFQL